MSARDRREEELAELELRFGLGPHGDYPRSRRGFDPEELDQAPPRGEVPSLFDDPEDP